MLVAPRLEDECGHTRLLAAALDPDLRKERVELRDLTAAHVDAALHGRAEALGE
jgi:hypothetical protein